VVAGRSQEEVGHRRVAGSCAQWYAVYLLCWYKSTNTDAAAAPAAAAAAGATLERAVSLSNMFNPQVFLNALRQQVCAYELLMNFNVYEGYDNREGVDI
jgi:hypothetical protein